MRDNRYLWERVSDEDQLLGHDEGMQAVPQKNSGNFTLGWRWFPHISMTKAFVIGFVFGILATFPFLYETIADPPYASGNSWSNWVSVLAIERYKSDLTAQAIVAVTLTPHMREAIVRLTAYASYNITPQYLRTAVPSQTSMIVQTPPETQSKIELFVTKTPDVLGVSITSVPTLSLQQQVETVVALTLSPKH